MSTEKSDQAPSCHSYLTSASAASVRVPSDAQPLAASSSQSGKRRHHLLDLPDDDNPRLHKQFEKDSVRHSKLVAELPVIIGPSSGAIADAF